jgi:hypothetical protein
MIADCMPGTVVFPWYIYDKTFGKGGRKSIFSA